MENPNNTVKEEWDAIERTLYQENGKKISNPALLKECKLWSESFPHLRVRGTQIDIGVGPDTSITKCVQTSNANPSWVKVNEKREEIKKQLVGQLVQRLISKFNNSKEDPSGVLQYLDKTELSKNEEKYKNLMNSNVPTNARQIEMECYFERGKLDAKNLGRNKKVTVKNENRTNVNTGDYSDLSDNIEKEFNIRFLSNSMLNEKNNLLRSLKTPPKNESNVNDLPKEMNPETSYYYLKNQSIFKKEKKIFKASEVAKESRVKTDRSSDSLSSLTKPFEATKKIDKKYEALLESILKNKGFETTESKKSEEVKPEKKMSYRESLEKLRVNTNYEEYMKRHKQLPKINNFTNNWMSRAENYPFKDYHRAMEEFQKESPIKCTKASASSSALQVPRSHNNVNNNWVARSESSTEVKKPSSMKKGGILKNSKPINKNEYFIEDIKVERPKLFIKTNRNTNPSSYKSSSCGDLQRRKQGSINSERKMKSGGDKKKSEVTNKNSTRGNAGSVNCMMKTDFNKNVTFPPIESGKLIMLIMTKFNAQLVSIIFILFLGIIITDLNGRTKVPTRTLPKKYW